MIEHTNCKTCRKPTRALLVVKDRRFFDTKIICADCDVISGEKQLRYVVISVIVGAILSAVVGAVLGVNVS